MTRRIALAVLLPLLALSFVLAQPAAPLEELETVEELRDLFEKDAGAVRLVLLLSPT